MALRRIPVTRTPGDLLEPLFSRLRWLTVLIPAASVLVLVLLALLVLEPLGSLWVAVLAVAVVTVAGATVFSRAVFGILERVQRRLVEQNRQLRALSAVDAVVSETFLELDELADRTLEKVIEVTGTRAGVIFLMEEGAGLKAVSARGQGHEALLGLGSSSLEKVPEGVVLRTPAEAADQTAEAVRRAGLAYFIVVPLRSKGRLVGMMALASEEERRLAGPEQAWLTTMGSQIGVAIDHARLYHTTHRRTEYLSALNEASLSLTSERSLEAVLQKVVDLSRRVVEARYGALGVFGEDGRIQQFITSGISKEERERIGRWPEGKGLLGLVMREGQTLRIADIASDSRAAGFPPHHPVMRNLLALPITYKGRTIGDLYLADKEGADGFTEEDEEAVTLFAAQAAVAIENARLYERVQALAVVEERERIGMDLHDGVMQAIYGVGLNLEGCAEDVDDNPAAVRERLNKAIGDLNQIIRDIRNYIFGLRPQPLAERSFSRALAELVEELRVNSLIEADLVLDGEKEPLLSEEQAANLFHIAQESLANVQKHAQATRVQARLSHGNGILKLSIRDNGVGFDVDVPPVPSHRGVRNIRERVQALGGRLTLRSAPGWGTEVTVEVPLGEG